jgi:ParB/RepB/Spo0J family partition protein
MSENTQVGTTTEQVSATAIKRGKKAIDKKFNTLEELKVEYISVSEIHPNDYNPNRQNTQEFELLLSSMKEDGFTTPIVVQREHHIIVDGEHRWRAATQLGFKEIPVVFVNMTPEQARIATLRHNRARGEEDIELTASLLRDLEALGALDHAADSLGMSDVDIQKLLNEIKTPEFLANPDGEYGTAWTPTDTYTPENNAGYTEVRSVQAEETLRDKKEKLDAAKTVEEVQMVQQTITTARINFVVTSEQHNIIMRALTLNGADPVNTLLEWAVARLANDHEAKL